MNAQPTETTERYTLKPHLAPDGHLNLDPDGIYTETWPTASEHAESFYADWFYDDEFIDKLIHGKIGGRRLA